MFNLPSNVKEIINTIEGAGYTAWCVGGCVRDMLMGKSPDDYDIASSAPCEEIQRLFDKTIPTGIKHGTVTVIMDGTPYEVTRYRVDGEYNDNRHPENVNFTADFSLDLSRRDFTVNAIGYNENRGLCDLYCGKEDIEKKIIRAVGNPSERFLEDALRIIRAIRFSSVLDFSIEEDTLNAIKKHANLLENIASERVTIELLKALSGNKPSTLGVLVEAGGLSSFGVSGKADWTILDRLPNISLLRLAALAQICFADIHEVVQRLRLSNKQKTELFGYYEIFSLKEITLPSIKPYAKKVEYHNLSAAVKAIGILKEIDTDELSETAKKAYENNEPYAIEMLDISGNEIKELGFTGSEIGEVQRKLLLIVLDNPKLNTKEKLVSAIFNYKTSD